MADLLLHAKTKQAVRAFLKKPSHALLITGQPGSGKETLARYLAAELVGIQPDRLTEYPYFTVLAKPSDKQEISIDAIRELIHSLKLKATISKGGQAQKMVLIIGGHNLSEEAQNAMLKLIEEPPAGTIFIMTVPSDMDVLPTIASRAQKISTVPVSLEDARQFFKGKYPAKDIESAWSLSQGAIGLLCAILENNQEHPLKIAVDSAKSLLKMNRYERVAYLDGLSGSKENLLNFLDALNRVLAALQTPAIRDEKASLVNRLIASRRLVNRAISQLQTNTSPRLICLNLALNLSI